LEYGSKQDKKDIEYTLDFHQFYKKWLLHKYLKNLESNLDEQEMMMELRRDV